MIVPVKNLKILLSIKPDFRKISKLSSFYGVNGLDVFSLDTKFDSSAHCKNFAPFAGINEESATGITAGALGCYLYRHGAIESRNMTFEQGYAMNKPSEIRSKLKIHGSEIKEVWVGGRTTNTGETEISV